MSRWLFIVAALVILTLVIGGITRLTESGLSITNWKPLSGIVPPLNEAAWQAEFAHYRQIDQYSAIHAGMSLSQFKMIFFWEYLHRILGRIVGLALVIPMLWFTLRRAVPVGFTLRLFAIVLLVGLQGTLGWLMVRSGLQPGMTAVAPLWLSAHLLTALLTLSLIIWTALDLRGAAKGFEKSRLNGFSLLVLAALFLQLFYGALMAGLRAGHVAADWPLMQDRFFPAGIDWSTGIGHALVTDPYLVHFIHRWWAWAAAILLIVMARKLRSASQRTASVSIHALFGTQLLLGIATVVSGVSIWIAVAHQLTGGLLVAATVWGAHILGSNRN